MAPTTRSAAESDWNEGQTAEMHALQQQMATLMHQVGQLKAGNHQRDEEIDRLRRQSATRGQSEAGQRAETPARSDASVAPATVGSSSASGISKPMAFKGDKYDGTAGTLGRFLNRLENDFVLFP